uniref:Uncharacterized protein n=1 Tax=Romanomermis culicivorax TaxID=13658 RepID=A0A915JQF6_ROMCU
MFDSWDWQMFTNSVCYCNKFYLMSSDVNIWTNTILSFILLASIIINFVLYRSSLKDYQNFNLNTKAHHLQQRFQMANNIKTASLLTPMFLCQGITGLLVTILVSVIAGLTSDPSQVKSSIINCVISTTLIASLGMWIIPIFWVKKNNYLRLITLKKFPKWRHIFLMHGTLVEPHQQQMEIVATTTIRNIFVLQSSCRMKHDTNTVQYRLEPEKANKIIETMWATRATKRVNNYMKS